MPKEKIKGIGGWLILPIIGLFSTLPIVLYDLSLIYSIPKFNFYIGLLSFLDMVTLTWAIIALFSIFNKKMYTSKIMISYYIVNIIIILAIFFEFIVENFSNIMSPIISHAIWIPYFIPYFIYSIIKGFSDIMPPIISGAIWIPYFIYSKRVKNTFVK